MLGMTGSSTSRATACISTASRKVGPLRALPLEVDRRLHVHERQRHELGEAAGALLQLAHAQQVPRPVPVAVDVAEHDGGGAPAGPRRARSPSPRSHCAVVILSGHRTARTSSSRISAAVPGRLRQPRVLEPRQIVAQRQPQRLGAVPDLQRREGVHVDVGRRRFHRLDDGEIGLARVAGPDAALQAHLGGAALPGLARAAGDLLEARDRRASRDGRGCAGPWRRRRTCSRRCRCWCS